MLVERLVVQVDCAVDGSCLRIGDVPVLVRIEVGWVIQGRAWYEMFGGGGTVLTSQARAGSDLRPYPAASGAIVRCGTVHQMTCHAMMARTWFTTSLSSVRKWAG